MSSHLYCVIFGLLSVTVIKIYRKLTTRWDRSATCLVGKTTIVTGSNTGIGYYTALEFAKRGAKVILACRNRAKAEDARNKIIEATGNANVHVRLIDFASLASVRQFAGQIYATEKRLDILVNNAGVGWLDNDASEDGLNLLVQVNHFGPFLLTNLLMELLKRSAPSRIVNVSSIASFATRLDPDNLNAYPAGPFPKIINYANSKFLNILFTKELARQLKGTGVNVNALHPGMVETELFRDFLKLFSYLTTVFGKLFFKTAEEGAQTSIYVALSKDLNNISGEYFDNCRIAWVPELSGIANDPEFTRKVYRKSEELVKLSS